VQRIRIVVVIPAFNEEGKVGEVVHGILNDSRDVELIDEVLVVDDGSKDKTAIEAKEAGATVISHKTNKGVCEALSTGMKYAMRKKYDICVVMGGDAQDPPSEIPYLLQPIMQENYDFIQGSRYLNNQRTKDMPLSRAITTRLFTLFFSMAARSRVTDASNGFRAFRLSIFKDIEIPEKLDKWSFEPYLYLQAIKRGLKVKEVKVTKKYDLKRGYSKMQPITSWYSAGKPILREFLRPTRATKR